MQEFTADCLDHIPHFCLNNKEAKSDFTKYDLSDKNYFVLY